MNFFKLIIFIITAGAITCCAKNMSKKTYSKCSSQNNTHICALITVEFVNGKESALYPVVLWDAQQDNIISFTERKGDAHGAYIVEGFDLPPAKAEVHYYDSIQKRMMLVSGDSKDAWSIHHLGIEQFMLSKVWTDWVENNLEKE